MSQEELTIHQLALQFMIPRSEVRRLMDTGRLPWELSATGERVVTRDTAASLPGCQRHAADR
jgi:hypothetical protein